MKLPNGYGSVYKLSGNRRNPYIARKTVGWEFDEKTKKKKQVCQTIGYYPTRAKALQALSDYNCDPYDISKSGATFAEIFELWKKAEFDDNSNSNTVRSYNAAYKHCSILYNKKMSAITTPQLQQVLDDHSDMSYERANKIRNLFSKMYKYCVKMEYLKRNKAEGLNINHTQPSKPREAFTSAEISLLWEHAKNRYVKIILILIYSGVRIGELLAINKSDVDLKNQIFIVRESKTEAGRNRTVPIADKVLPFWEEFINESPNQAVFTNSHGLRLTYDNFRRHFWTPLKENLGLNHSLHETRHTCISQLTMRGANATIIKIIVGHKSIMSLTEKTYTHIEPKELVATINLIP